MRFEVLVKFVLSKLADNLEESDNDFLVDVGETSKVILGYVVFQYFLH